MMQRHSCSVVAARFVMCVVVIASASCATVPAPLPTAPTSDAPFAQRLAYAERYAPRHVQTAPLSVRRHWTQRATLVLAGGDVVRSPADLLPAVAAGSATARAAMNATRAEELADIWGVASTATVGTAAAGIMVFLGLSLALSTSDPLSDRSTLKTAALATGIGSMLGAGVSGVLTLVASTLAEDGAVERETAFYTYDRALQQRLAIDQAAQAGASP